MDDPQCRFCHDTIPPLITPCDCTGSVKYIHKSCILRWATMDGELDYSKLSCSLCTVPYRIEEIRLESYATPSHLANVLLHNSAAASIMINYLSILYGIHTGQTISQRILVAHMCIYLIYGTLYCLYIRVKNVALYTEIAIERHSYMYALIQLYSAYASYTEQYALMSITAMLAQTIVWREHITLLELVNDRLLKNGAD